MIETSFTRLLREVMEKYQPLRPEPVERHHAFDLFAVHGLPSVHFDPSLVGIFGFVSRTNHHPLEFVRFLPFLQLSGAKPFSYPNIKISKYNLEFLDFEVVYPSP